MNLVNAMAVLVLVAGAAEAQTRPVTPTQPRAIVGTAPGRLTLLWEQPELNCPAGGWEAQGYSGYGVKVGRVSGSYPPGTDTGEFLTPVKCVWSNGVWTHYYVFDRGAPGVRYYFRVFAYNTLGRSPDTNEVTGVFPGATLLGDGLMADAGLSARTAGVEVAAGDPPASAQFVPRSNMRRVAQDRGRWLARFFKGFVPSGLRNPADALVLVEPADVTVGHELPALFDGMGVVVGAQVPVTGAVCADRLVDGTMQRRCLTVEELRAILWRPKIRD